MKIGFIGCGNMATAILKGILKSGEVAAADIIASAKSDKTREKIEKELGIKKADTNAQVVEFADVVFLAVKPQFLEGVLDEFKASVKEDHIFISIAPGKTLQWFADKLGEKTKVIRTMPNTPAMIGEGMTGVSVKQGELSGEEMDEIKKLFDACGKTEFIEERLMDAVVCASGSSPAFVYQFIEALADSAVRYGMPRKQAYVFAAQAVKGAAAMVLETGEHPGVLKDQVCSPAGTTIEGVAALEEYGLRNAVLKASEAVYNRCTKI